MARIPFKVHCALLFVQLSFGAFHVVGKSVLSFVPPLALTGIRVLIASPILFILARTHHYTRPQRADMLRLAVLGLLGVFSNQLLYIFGLQWTTATSAAILMLSIPVLTVAAGAAFGIEGLSRGKAVGVGLAVVGALVLLDPASFVLSSRANIGNLLIVLNCVFYAGYLVLQRPLLRRLSALTVVAWAFIFGGTATLVVAVPSMTHLSLAKLPGKVWVGLAFITFIATIVNYALNSWAIGHSSPAVVASYITIQPVFAALLAIIFLGERITIHQIVGFALIVAGLVWVSRSSLASSDEVATT